MIVAVRTKLIALLICAHVFPECLPTLLAHKRHLHRLRELVHLRLGVALGAIVPLPAARCTDRDLGVEDVLAHFFLVNRWDNLDGAFDEIRKWTR